ncbi:hypothetical protein [Rarobacter incanus]|uniref:Uncharacterized protein n=1 Tax=Rarobacter incanus TaxID=153494 RepID=A0A542SPJ4_9MICO|nr:hypothetical protein [Rarobacter incanus]TQK76544.1 hypothetical protein FB389_1227 [Rarobacter incanus]
MSGRRPLRALVWVFLGILLAGAGSPIAHAATLTYPATTTHTNPAPTATTTTTADSVVLLGLRAVNWETVAARLDDYPLLRTFMSEGLVAQSLVNNGIQSRCAIDGWLMVSAGTRAWYHPESGCIEPAVSGSGDDARVADWGSYTRAAATQSYRPALGTLGDAVAAAGISAGAIGPGAAVALATSGGTVAGTVSSPPTESALTQALDELAATRSLVVVDVAGSAAAALPVDQLRRTEAALATLDTGDPGLTHTTVVIASLTDDEGAAAPGSLQFFASNLDRVAGVASSASTRTQGLVLSTDLLATVCAQIEPLQGTESGIGSPIVSAPNSTRVGVRVAQDQSKPGAKVEADLASRITVLTNIATRSQAGAATQIPYVVGLGCAGALLAVLAFVRWRSRRTRLAIRFGALWLAFMPASTLVASATSWWRSDTPALALASLASLTALAFAAATISFIRSGTTRWPAAARMTVVVASVTALIITVDVIRGCPWSTGSPLGTQVLQAGRFYGMNNTAFALWSVALLTAVAMVSTRTSQRHRRSTLAAVIVIGLGLTGFELSSRFGADLGGGLALLPGFAVLAIVVARWRLTGARLVGCAIGAVALAAVGAWAAARGDSSSHIGRFMSTLASAETAATVGRKFVGAFGALATEPLLGGTALIAVGSLAALVWRWRDHARVPSWGFALVATCVTASALNDSGLAITGWMVLLAGSLVVVRRGPLPLVGADVAKPRAQPTRVDG